MANPKIRDPDFITPDMDATMMLQALARQADIKKEVTKQNEYYGELKYRVRGNKVVRTVQEGNDDTTFPISQDYPGFEINHASADPFRDADVDAERISSKGLIDRETIEKRNIFFIQNYELFHALYLTTKQEDHNVLASFLLRISHKEAKQPALEQLSKILFSFRDQLGLRDPYVILADEKSQKESEDKAAALQKAAAATPTEDAKQEKTETVIEETC